MGREGLRPNNTIQVWSGLILMTTELFSNNNDSIKTQLKRKYLK
jgi:hypothetical protein